MLFRKAIPTSSGGNDLALERLKNTLESKETIIIGAGAGLSTSAGFAYSGERFHNAFSDFEAKYGFHDMYSGGFIPITRWKNIGHIGADTSNSIAMRMRHSVYNELYELVKDKDYFILTTNVDHCIQKAGFEKNRLFYTRRLWTVSML